ncbi:MAG TPA: caspase family protein [Geminicoccaceae bacterium]|nr:caspase family protein [Geminicoccaceae bacterium]
MVRTAMVRSRWRVLFAVLLLIPTLNAAWAQTTAGRVALVVGNGQYVHAAPLPNPPRDAQAIAEQLRQLGFEVLEGIDLDRAAMDALLRQFADRLQGVDVGLFYYAGHGLQVYGQNYLAPIDAQLDEVQDLYFETVNLGLILQLLEDAPRTSLIFLDACRDNPLARNLARTLGTGRSPAVGRGLAQVEGGIGTLIAYATQQRRLRRHRRAQPVHRRRARVHGRARAGRAADAEPRA